MKKIVMMMAAIAVLCLCVVSCSNEVQDVNVVKLHMNESYLYRVTGSVYTTNSVTLGSSSFATTTLSDLNNGVEIKASLGLYDTTGNSVSVGSSSMIFYKVGESYYIKTTSGLESVTSKISGNPIGGDFTYTTGTPDTNGYINLTFSKM